MIQGLFDETEDTDQPEKEMNKAKKNVFADDVLFEITKPNHKKEIINETATEAAVAATAETAAGRQLSDETVIEEIAPPPSMETAGGEIELSPFDELEIEKLISPLTSNEFDVEEMQLPPFDEGVAGEKSSPTADEASNQEIISPLPNVVNVEEKQFDQPAINISFSEPHESFPVAEPITETDKRDAPPLFQTQYTPELPEDTARKSGLALSAGIALFVAVVFMMIIGWFADLLLGTSPWGIVCGILVGSIIGFYQFFRTTSQIIK